MRLAQSALLPAGLFRARFGHLGVGYFPLRAGTLLRRTHLVIHAIAVLVDHFFLRAFILVVFDALGDLLFFVSIGHRSATTPEPHKQTHHTDFQFHDNSPDWSLKFH